MADAARRLATKADCEFAPPHDVAEIVDELHENCFVDPRAHQWEVFQLVGGKWMLFGSASGATAFPIMPKNALSFSPGLHGPYNPSPTA
jgi:hypothetical protein